MGDFHRRHASALGLSAALLAASPWLLGEGLHRFGSAGSDWLAYTRLGDALAAGRPEQLVNPYWPPLLPAAWAALGAWGTHLLPALICIWAWPALLRRLDLRPALHHVAALLITPWVAYALLVLNTPDLWSLALLLAACSQLGHPRLFQERRRWVLIGLLAALAYAAKAYNLVFWLVALAGIGLLRLRRTGNRRELRGPLLAIGTLLAISLPWVMAISAEAGHVTLSTAGSYTCRVALLHERVHPVLVRGLIEPPYPAALCAWEEITATGGDAQPLSELRFSEWAARQAVLLGENLFLAGRLLLYRGAALWLLPVAVLLWRFRGRWSRTLGLHYLALGGLYLSGYLLIWPEERYLWPVWALLAVAGLDAWRRQVRHPRRQVLGGVVLFLLVPSLWPMHQLMETHHTAAVREWPATSAPVRMAMSSRPRLACWQEAWHEAYHLASRKQWRFWGEAADAPPAAAAAELRRHRIDYLAVMAGAPLPPALQRRLQAVPVHISGLPPGLRLYRLAVP